MLPPVRKETLHIPPSPLRPPPIVTGAQAPSGGHNTCRPACTRSSLLFTHVIILDSGPALNASAHTQEKPERREVTDICGSGGAAPGPGSAAAVPALLFSALLSFPSLLLFCFVFFVPRSSSGHVALTRLAFYSS